jgi:choline monooxygenase
MFVHQNQLEHSLEPRAYYSPEQYEVELQRLFRPAWQVIAAKGELRRPGDFKTLEFLGQPLIVRSFDGELRTFVNVCAHRHSRLTHQERGNCDRLRCQYHGWEYKADGYTSHIPEARVFRPMDREMARLTTVRTEMCGDLLFATLDPDAKPLAEFLGPFYDKCQHWFDSSFLFAKRWTTLAPANWKVLTENSVESYHVPMVHKWSFGVAPAEELCQHQLTEHWSTFESDETGALPQRPQRFVARTLGLPISNLYTHHLVYPNVQFVIAQLVRIVVQVIPKTPVTSEQQVWVFTAHGSRKNPWAWWVRTIMRRIVTFESRRILNEDASILQDVQKGLEASRQRGVIGTREERVFAFQQYVLRQCQNSVS